MNKKIVSIVQVERIYKNFMCKSNIFCDERGFLFVSSVGNQPDNKTTKSPDNKTTNIFYPRNSWQCGFFMLTLRPNNYTL